MYKRILSLLLCVALVCSFVPVTQAQEQSATSSKNAAADDAQQLGVWLYATTVYERGAGSAEALMQQYAELGITDVYLQVKGIDGKLAWASNVTDGTRLYADRDIVAEVCQAAAPYGIRIHAWMMAARDDSYAASHKGALYYHFRYGYGTEVNRYVSLRDEGYLAYMADLVRELVQNYGVDGIHLDNARYGGMLYDWGMDARDTLLSKYGITIAQYNAATLALCAQEKVPYGTTTASTAGYNGGASYSVYAYREGGTVPTVTPIRALLEGSDANSDAAIGARAFYALRTDTVASFIEAMDAVAGEAVTVSSTLMPDSMSTPYFAAIYGQDAAKLADKGDYVALCSFTKEFSADTAWLTQVVDHCLSAGCKTLIGVQTNDTAYGADVYADTLAAYQAAKNGSIVGLCLSRGDTAVLAGADFFPEQGELRMKLSNQSAQNVSKLVLRLQNGMKVTSVGESANWRNTYAVSVSADGTSVTVSANGADILHVGEMGYLNLTVSGAPAETAPVALVQAYSGTAFAEISAFCGAVVHTYTTYSTTPPSCGEAGSTSYTCSHCDKVLTEYTATLPHGYTYTDNRDTTHTAICAACGDSVLAAHTYENGLCVCGAKQSENNMLYFSFNQSEADALRYHSPIYGYTDFNDTANWRLSNWSNTGVAGGTVFGTIGKDGTYLRTSIGGTTNLADCPLAYVPGENDVLQVCFKLENTTATNVGVKPYFYETGAENWDGSVPGAGRTPVVGEYMTMTIPLAGTAFTKASSIQGFQIAFYNVSDGDIAVDYIYVGPESHLPTAHDFEVVVTPKTCTTEGYSTYTCKNCGLRYKTDYVPASHTVVTDAALEATCTETGLTEGKHCEACGEVFVAQEIVPAKGHSYDAETHACDCGAMEQITVKISWNGELVEGWVFTHDYGTEAVLPTLSAPEGKAFVGYAESENGEIVWRTERLYTYTKNVTLYAVFADICTVTWNVDGKTTEETYVHGELPVFKGSTDKAAEGCTAYDFEGWDKEITAAAGDITYTAVYTAREAHSYDEVTHICSVCGETEQITIRISWNGELIENWVITEDYGTRSTLPTLGAPDGYRFVGYAESENGEIVWRQGEYYTYTKDVTLYAVFVAIYTVTWNVDGVETKEAYEHGQTPVFKGSTDKAAEGCTVYDFASWDKEITAVSGDVTYTAVYTTRTVHLHVVTDEAVKPSCTETGLTEGAHCEACGEVTLAQEVVPTIPHSYTKHTNNGEDHTVACDVCGDSYNEAHSYVNDYCICGDTLIEAFLIIGSESVPYYDFFEALEAAQPGETLVLNKDLTLKQRIVIEADDEIRLDLNGHKLTTLAIDSNYDVLVKGKLTLCDSKENGELVLSGNFGIGVSTTKGASLTVESGKYTHAGDYLIGSWGNVSITGGNFSASYCAVNAFAGTANVSGGSFAASADDSEVILGNSSLTGGSYDRDVSEYCAVGYVVEQNSDGSYAVVVCTHENCEYTYENIGAESHNVLCACGAALPNESHSYEDGACTDCGRGLVENGDIVLTEADGVKYYTVGAEEAVAYEGSFCLRGTTTQYRLIVENGEHTIVLRDAHIDLSEKTENASPIEGKDGATLHILLENENTLTGGYNGAGIYVVEDAVVTIDGTGKLTAIGGAEAAGIGTSGGYFSKAGEININGGTIIAKGGESGCGIGSSDGAEAGVITITGGNITAIGGKDCAGIGGGEHIGVGEGGQCGQITISGGSITAIGGSEAAGIGSGRYCEGNASDPEDNFIRITGGEITAIGGGSGAGIGSGSQSKALKIYIEGGNITATGGSAALGYATDEETGEEVLSTIYMAGAGIGNGFAAYGAQIYISGGTITAIGGNGLTDTLAEGDATAELMFGAGAGIGGGSASHACDVVITGGNIKASAGELVGEADASQLAQAVGYGGDVQIYVSEDNKQEMTADRSGTVTDGNGNEVSLAIITIDGVTEQTEASALRGVENYGMKDVKTLDINKLYLYLPEGSNPTSVKAGKTYYDGTLDASRCGTYTLHTQHSFVDPQSVYGKGVHACSCYCGATQEEAHDFNHGKSGTCLTCGVKILEAGSIVLRQIGDETCYCVGSGDWVAYTDRLYLTGSSEESTICVADGWHLVTFDHVSLTGVDAQLCSISGYLDVDLIGETHLVNNISSEGSGAPAIELMEASRLYIRSSDGTGVLYVRGAEMNLGGSDIEMHEAIYGAGDVSLLSGKLCAENQSFSGGLGITGNLHISGGEFVMGHIAARNVTIAGGSVTVTGDSGLNQFDINLGGTHGIYATENVTISGGAVHTSTFLGGTGAIGGGNGYMGLRFEVQTHGIYAGGKVTISGGTVDAAGNLSNYSIGDFGEALYGNGIGGHAISASEIVITGGNVKLVGKEPKTGCDIWSGCDGTCEICTAPNPWDSASHAAVRDYTMNVAPTDGNGNEVYLNTITLEGITAQTTIDSVDAAGYGLNDVKTLDTDKLYIWLTEGTAPTAVTIGEDKYVGTLTDNAGTFTLYVGPIYDAKLRFGHSLKLENDISINFIGEAAVLDTYDTFYLECKVPVYNGNELVGYDTVKIDPVFNGTNYDFTLLGITAKMMNNEVEAVFRLTKNGQEYYSKTDVYSVAEYAYTKLSSNDTAAVKTICANLLRYGALAQVQFNYRTDAPVDAAMTDADKAFLTDLSTVEATNYMKQLADMDAPLTGWYSASLVLENKVVMRLVANLKNYSGDVSELSMRLTFTDSKNKEITVDRPLEVYNEASKLYAVSFDGLRATEMRSIVSAALYKNGERVSKTVQYSIESYAAYMKTDICYAMLAYGDSAYAYFATKSE